LGNSRELYDRNVNSKRVLELERELERTRLEMRERQNKVNFSNGKKL
jgi:hypothetical protein